MRSTVLPLVLNTSILLTQSLRKRYRTKLLSKRSPELPLLLKSSLLPSEIGEDKVRTHRQLWLKADTRSDLSNTPDLEHTLHQRSTTKRRRAEVHYSTGHVIPLTPNLLSLNGIASLLVKTPRSDTNTDQRSLIPKTTSHCLSV
ncbi:hypothetical protein F511_18255 [Dorcoceras hygrometricum]|uniref:Uncharacterized protein n=1 Tax=Dorcoceras hygrometricum TaxID=472368 RepID=A0A2Z7B9Z0_9LAMI|nr:hypothetical protein F511_18255 [Dorcoceras hygrometricum]